jgi:DNA-binding transcriptional LysR family regulator
MDRLDELAIFVAILDEGSLAAAGRKLRRSPPAVTRALAVLEARVGARLLERTTRRSRPTEAGKRLADYGRQLLAGYGEAVREAAAGAVRGVLRVTAPLVFGRRHITPIVASFLDAYPSIRVELVLSDKNLDLVDDGLDVALRIGALPDSNLVVRKVGEVRSVLIASPRYLLGRPPLTAPSELARHDVILASTRPGSLEMRFAGPRRARLVQVVPRLLVNDVDAMLIAVRAGRGIGRALSYQVADELAAGTLVRLLRESEPPPVPVQLVVPSAQHLSAKARGFLDHAARSLATLGVIRPEP